MTLCNGWPAALIHKQAISVVVGLRFASCSPDGRILATIDTVPLAIPGSGVLSRYRFYTICSLSHLVVSECLTFLPTGPKRQL